jgi:gluconolactonase
MSVEIRDQRFRSIVGGDAPVERLGTGFIFTEGPMWHEIEKHLIFSDMPGDTMRKWTPDGKTVTFRKPCHKTNGNYYDLQGRLVSCEHASSRVTRTEKDGSLTVLASHYKGKELNSPNDIIVKSDGSLYFSDPTYGRMDGFGLLREQDLDFQGVYRIDGETGELTLLADDFTQPNGLTFSLDESKLYVGDTSEGHIRVFDVEEDGSLSNSRVWAKPTGKGSGAPDGMKADSAGNIYCTGPGGVHVFAPDATSLGVIHVPEGPANFTWGGDDLRDLFITASTSLYRTRVKVPGRSLFTRSRK